MKDTHTVRCVDEMICFPPGCWQIPCLLLLTLSVYHPVSCSYCRGNGMTGFRYRCLRCRGYQLCQDCFWHGNASGSHNNQHQMKEHSSWVSQKWPTCLSQLVAGKGAFICMHVKPFNLSCWNLIIMVLLNEGSSLWKLVDNQDWTVLMSMAGQLRVLQCHVN